MASAEEVLEQVIASPGVVALVGGLDTGKTTLAVEMVRRAARAGVVSAFLDADVGQKTVGPPATVGVKLVRTLEDASEEGLARPDRMAFVGSTSPQGHLLPMVRGVGLLARWAREMGASLVVLDTTGLVTGSFAEHLKVFKLEAAGVGRVVALERGEELRPVLEVVRRFARAEVFRIRPLPQARPVGAEERARRRAERLKAHFSGRLKVWRVKGPVFFPSLPPGLEQGRLEGLLCGLEGPEGECLALGILKTQEGMLKVVGPEVSGVVGVRLGSLRVGEDWATHRVSLQQLLGR